jgi:hypothetical protein
MKRHRSILLAAAVLLLCALPPVGADAIRGILEQVSLDNMVDDVAYLSGETSNITTRWSTTAGCTAAQNYIKARFESYGLETRLQDWGTYNGSPCADNVIATLPGTTHPETVVVICGHYDSYSNYYWLRAPGADDNASAIGVVLEAARIMSRYKFEYTVEFIAFSGEEMWMYGSYFYVQDARAHNKDIRACFNYDMLMYEAGPGDDLDIDSHVATGSDALAQTVVDVAAEYVPSLPVGINYGGASDHLAFTDYGYKAIGVVENTAQEIWGGSNPHYHTTHDILANMNMQFYEKCAKVGIASAAVWASPIAGEQAAPEGFVNPGWNWISIPEEPYEPDAGRIFGEPNVTNRLYRWNPVDKNIELCPDDFTKMEVGRGYLLFSLIDQSPAYSALPGELGDFEIPLTNMGWTWIGQPHPWVTTVDELAIRDEATSVVRTAMEDYFAPDPWMNWNILYWDSMQDTYGLVGFNGVDDYALRPWMGYRVWTHRDGLTLLVP